MAYRSSSAAGIYPSDTVTLTAPSGIQDGDILLIAVSVENNPAITWPSGFTEWYNDAQTKGLRAAYKVASSESGNYTCSWTGSTSHAAVMQAYSGRSSSMPPSVYGGTVQDVSPDTLVNDCDVTGTGISATSGSDVAVFVALGYDNNGDYGVTADTPANSYTKSAEIRAMYDGSSAPYAFVSAHSFYRDNVSGATGNLTFSFTAGGGTDKVEVYTVLLVALPAAGAASIAPQAMANYRMRAA